MHTMKNNENTLACTVAISQSLGVTKKQSGGRSQSRSPSPASIRKNRPFQSLNSNQTSRRALGEDKENQRPNHISQRPTGVRLDQSAVILQPPTHFSLSSELSQSQSALHPLISKPAIQQVQLGLIPLSTQWSPNQNYAHTGRAGNVENVQCNPNHFSYTREEMDGPEGDPFAQLSARTLALMDQPESEVTIYDCEYCDKTYQGKHARSIWRRHLSDKHKIPLSTQPRRTRWDNDANRPKTEEERRERTLESKRRWARKNRAAKKAARDGQRNSIDQSVANISETVSSEQYRASPNRSRAPSPSSFPVSLNHRATDSLDYCPGTAQFAQSESTQGEPRGHVSVMTRSASVPHTFTPYPSMGSRASLPFGNSAYNPSFCISQVLPSSEWSLPIPSVQNTSPYSFETIATSGHSPGQFSDRFTMECLQKSHSSRPFHSIARRHSPTNYAAEMITQQLDERPETADGSYPSASWTSQYGDWDLEDRFNTLPVSLAQLESSSCEAHFKRPRLTHSSSIPGPLQKLDLQKSHSTFHLGASADNRDFQQIGIQDLTKSSIFAGDIPPVNSQTSMGDWNGHLLETPSGFSRLPFGSNVLASPVGGTGLFDSPNSNLGKSLGLTLNGSVHGEDCIGDFQESAASTWDTVHQRT